MLKIGKLYLTPKVLKTILLAASAIAIYSFGKAMGEVLYHFTN
ncbi:hypothetical protein [Pontibacter indicus]|uniref:Uncharacterized protein n=1 Tax=Pontibacter indicus TaxID=1317125 RepID=A0A1R3XFH4_9BACT|nr:hypothetical protein [Pontibacter indicus]SIT90083.1 hypothetical protein SAMN05444128_2205 [Pontibacter indicus]